MSQRIPLLLAILAILVPASASAQWRSDRRPRPHRVVRPHVFQVAPGTRVVDLRDRRHVRRLGHLPPSVEVLDVAGTGIRQLPNLPPRLRSLNVSRTAIQSLPHLPRSLRVLTARDGRLRALPHLPYGLERLHVSGSPIHHVPNLPPSIRVIDVSRTPMTSLPPLPNGLRVLRANGTRIRVGYIPPTVVTLEGVVRPGWRRGRGRPDRVTVRPRRPGVVVQPTQTYGSSWDRWRRQRAR